MTETFFFGAVSAIWLGILTSISPCPLATNIAAISFIGKHVGISKRVFLCGILYMLGRVIVYLLLSVIIVAGVLAITDLSFFLQENINRVLGPALLIAGIILLDLIKFDFPGLGLSTKSLEKAVKHGIWGAGTLGVIFALSFCPVSAALFFGSLIPLSVEYNSMVVLPSLYGIGTALPVLLFAFVIAFGIDSIGRLFNRLTAFELWARRITGIIFILVGIYYVSVYIFGANFF